MKVSRWLALGALAVALLALPGCYAREPVSESFLEIATRAETMSRADFARYAEGFAGRPVRWSGWVRATRQKRDGDYELLIDANPPGTPGTPRSYVLPVTEAEGAALKEGQQVAFEGTIKKVGMMFMPSIEFERVKLL